MNYTNMYKELRNQALEINAKEINIDLENENQVFAALIDFKTRRRSVSLFCSIDGTVSLYLDDSNPILGLGFNENVKKAAMSLLISSGQTLSKLPQNHNDLEWNKEKIHLLAKEKYVVNVNKDSGIKVIDFLDFLVQNIIVEIRKVKTVDL